MCRRTKMWELRAGWATQTTGVTLFIFIGRYICEEGCVMPSSAWNHLIEPAVAYKTTDEDAVEFGNRVLICCLEQRNSLEGKQVVKTRFRCFNFCCTNSRLPTQNYCGGRPVCPFIHVSYAAVQDLNYRYVSQMDRLSATRCGLAGWRQSTVQSVIAFKCHRTCTTSWLVSSGV